MGCNCGKKASAATSARAVSARPTPTGTTTYKLVLNGYTQSFGSKLEADAANARLGGRGVVRQA